MRTTDPDPQPFKPLGERVTPNPSPSAADVDAEARRARDRDVPRRTAAHQLAATEMRG